MLILYISLAVLVTSVCLAIAACRNFVHDNNLVLQIDQIDNDTDNIVMLNTRASLDYQACSLLREYAEIQALPPGDRIVKLILWQKRLDSWQRVDAKRMDKTKYHLKPFAR